MSEAVLVGLISGVFGVIVALIVSPKVRLGSSSRLTTDAVSLVDASGTVVSNLTDEIERLERLNEKLANRISLLEAALQAAGINPFTIR